MSTTSDHFPTEVAGLPEARPSETVELSDGDHFDLHIAPVAKRIAQEPGPLVPEAPVDVIALRGAVEHEQNGPGQSGPRS